MYELECLRRRMEDKVAAAAAKEVELEELNLDLASAINGGYEAKNGTLGEEKIVESIIDDMAKQQTDEDFTGHSCLLVTWKTNPEIEKFKVSDTHKQSIFLRNTNFIRIFTWRVKLKLTREKASILSTLGIWFRRSHYKKVTKFSARSENYQKYKYE